MTMPSATEIRTFAAVIPAGTPINAPATIDVSFPARTVDGVTVVVPAGANGAVGFQVLNSGLPVIPYNGDGWVIASQEVITWPLTGQITSGSWQVAGYNLGKYDHTVYLRFLLSPPPSPGMAGLVTIAAPYIGSAPSADDMVGP